MKKFNKNTSIIIFIVLSNIVLKLPFINNPISDWHSWNQVTTVATARYIVEDGWASLFNAKVDLFESFKEDSNATFAEFPILSGLIALGFMITGDEYEWAARLISILISTIGVLYFYLLVRDTAGQQVAIYAAMFYLISPMNWYFHRTIMTDVLMVSFVIGGLYHYYHWINNQKWADFIISAFFTIIASLSKAYALYIGIVYLCLLLENHGWRKLFNGKNILYGFLTLTPIISWIYYCFYQMSKMNSGNNLMTDAGLLGPISIWFELDYWSSLLSSVGDFTLSAFGFLIFIYTFTRHFSKLKESKIALYWLGAVFFYFLFVREGNREHDYYQMPFAAPVLFITAIGINQLFIQIKNGYKPKSCQIFTVLFWSLLIIVSGKYSYTKARLDMSPVVLGKKMKELNQGRDYVLVIDPDSLQRNQAVYYAKSKGWHIRKLPELKTIQEYKAHGVRYMGINYKSNALQNAAPHLALYERNFKKAWQGSSKDRYKKPKTLFIFKL